MNKKSVLGSPLDTLAVEENQTFYPSRLPHRDDFGYTSRLVQQQSDNSAQVCTPDIDNTGFRSGNGDTADSVYPVNSYSLWQPLGSLPEIGRAHV